MDTALWQYRMYHLFWQGVDLFFPPHCAGCGKAGERWCETCQQAVKPVSAPYCPKCGLPVEQTGLCAACRTHLPSFDVLRSWAVFRAPLRRALHQLKYRHNLGLGEALALQMRPFAASIGWSVDVLIPVPLSSARFRERGYNQVNLVARPLAWLLGWAYDPGALRRVRETRSQVGLSARERHQNVLHAFRAEMRRVSGKRVVLMDDVATTGATLSAAAHALREAGAERVYALSIARALPSQGLHQA